MNCKTEASRPSATRRSSPNPGPSGSAIPHPGTNKRPLACLVACFMVPWLIVSCITLPGDPPYKASTNPVRQAKTAPRGMAQADSLLASLTEALDKTTSGSPEEIRTLVSALYSRYCALDRTTLGHDDLMELKFAWLNFDRLVLDSLLQRIVSAPTADLPAWYSTLAALPLTPATEKLVPLARQLKSLPSGQDKDAALASFAQYLAGLGDSRIQAELAGNPGLKFKQDTESALLAGPSVASGIKAGHMSGEPFDKWSANPGMTSYVRSNGMVRFRGQDIEVGDIFLVQEHNDSESLFTAASDAETYLYHVGTYVEPLVNGRRIPAIYEAYEAGVRLVPLHEWLGRDFITYGEHYRIDQALTSPGWQDRLSANALAMSREPHGYDILSSVVASGSDRYANCVSASLYLFRRTGITLPHRDSPITGHAADNLTGLGVQLRDVPSPEGVAVQPACRMVGLIDNDYAFLTLARDLIGSRFHRFLHQETLVIKPKGNYGFYRWGLRLVAAKDPFWEPALLSLFGFTGDNAPDGPPDLMSLVLAVQDSINEAMPGFYRDLVDLLADWDFSRGLSWTEIQADPAVGTQVDRHMAEIHTWFKPD